MGQPDGFLPHLLKRQCNESNTFDLAFSRFYFMDAEDKYGTDCATTITDPCPDYLFYGEFRRRLTLSFPWTMIDDVEP